MQQPIQSEAPISDNVLNLTQIAAWLEQSKIQLREMYNREMVAFIGLTGSGKSTAINILQGRQIGPKVISNVKHFDVVDNFLIASPKIGHRLESETMHPELFQFIEPLPYSLCDTVGFNDNKTREGNICSYLTLKRTIDSCKRVRALVVVFDVKLLLQRLSKDLINMANLLFNMLSPETVDNTFLYFIYTKPIDDLGDSLDLPAIIEIIQKLIADSENDKLPGFDAVKRFLLLAIKNSMNSVVFSFRNLEELSQQRHTMLRLLGNAKPVDKRKFLFSIDMNSHPQFITALTNIANRYLGAYEIYNQALYEESSIADQVHLLKGEVVHLEHDPIAIPVSQSRKRLEMQRAKIGAELAQLENALKRMTSELSALNAQQARLNQLRRNGGTIFENGHTITYLPARMSYSCSYSINGREVYRSEAHPDYVQITSYYGCGSNTIVPFEAYSLSILREQTSQRPVLERLKTRLAQLKIEDEAVEENMLALDDAEIRIRAELELQRNALLNEKRSRLEKTQEQYALSQEKTRKMFTPLQNEHAAASLAMLILEYLPLDSQIFRNFVEAYCNLNPESDFTLIDSGASQRIDLYEDDLARSPTSERGCTLF